MKLLWFSVILQVIDVQFVQIFYYASMAVDCSSNLRYATSCPNFVVIIHMYLSSSCCPPKRTDVGGKLLYWTACYYIQVNISFDFDPYPFKGCHL